MSKRNQHEWAFMANPGNNKRGELAYCELCNQWRFSDGKPFRMSWDEYKLLHGKGEIDASEVLGVKDYEPL